MAEEGDSSTKRPSPQSTGHDETATGPRDPARKATATGTHGGQSPSHNARCFAGWVTGASRRLIMPGALRAGSWGPVAASSCPVLCGLGHGGLSPSHHARCFAGWVMTQPANHRAR